MKTIELLVDSAHGQYIPQIFAKMILNEEIRIKDDHWKESILEHCREIFIDNEFYWDEMNDLLSKLTILDKDGNEYYVDFGDSGDLWAIPIGHSIEEFYE
jgi:hypothetical protein